MKYLVVGAGLSGLYTAYSLYKNFKTNEIFIIEKDDRIGGRMYTLDIEFGNIELGAGVILEIHTNILKLIHELGLEKDLIFNNNNLRSFAKLSYNGGKYKIDSITNINSTGFVDIVMDLKKKIDSGHIDINTARSYSLFHLIERTYGIKIANKMNEEFGYDGDFKQNSIDGIDMLIRDINTPTFVLKGGFSELILKLTEFLKSKGINIILNTELVDIQKYKEFYRCIVVGNRYIDTENIILSIPKNGLCKIPALFSIRKQLINTVYSKQLMRIYIFFPTFYGKSWFNNLNGIITTSTILRQIIPKDKKFGLLMIYVDNHSADALNYINETGKLKEEIMYHLRRIFSDIDIPDPIKIITKYWKEGTHIWKPTVNSEMISKKILKPFPNEKIYIVGESYSMVQQWSQGALDTVNNLMKILE